MGELHPEEGGGGEEKPPLHEVRGHPREGPVSRVEYVEEGDTIHEVIIEEPTEEDPRPPSKLLEAAWRDIGGEG